MSGVEGYPTLEAPTSGPPETQESEQQVDGANFALANESQAQEALAEVGTTEAAAPMAPLPAPQAADEPADEDSLLHSAFPGTFNDGDDYDCNLFEYE